MPRLIFMVLLVASFAATASQEYSFGAVTQRSPVLTAQYWNPILAYVSRTSRVNLSLKVAQTGDQSSDATVRGDYDFVYNNHQFKPSAARQGYTVILRPRGPDISGEVVTTELSAIRSLKDLEGKTVGFANSQAFAGYIVPMDQLMREGISVQPVFGGSQEGIMAQLAAGRVTAAGVNGSVMSDYATRENIKYRVLWSSGPFPALAISAHPRVPPSVVSAVRRAFIAMDSDSEGRAILERSAKLVGQPPPYGFLAATQADYRAYAEFFNKAVFKGAQ